MTDIIERLRQLYVQNGTDYVQEAADEIERLRSEVEALRDERDKALSVIRSNRVIVDALVAERDSLKASADRYLWLREEGDFGCTQKDGYGGSELKTGEYLDAAIDAARGDKT